VGGGGLSPPPIPPLNLPVQAWGDVRASAHGGGGGVLIPTRGWLSSQNQGVSVVSGKCDVLCAVCRTRHVWLRRNTWNDTIKNQLLGRWRGHPRDPGHGRLHGLGVVGDAEGAVPVRGRRRPLLRHPRRRPAPDVGGTPFPVTKPHPTDPLANHTTCQPGKANQAGTFVG